MTDNQVNNTQSAGHDMPRTRQDYQAELLRNSI
jgi:hypothetical protein